jgi:hypothetical protein
MDLQGNIEGLSMSYAICNFCFFISFWHFIYYHDSFSASVHVEFCYRGNYPGSVSTGLIDSNIEEWRRSSRPFECVPGINNQRTCTGAIEPRGEHFPRTPMNLIPQSLHCALNQHESQRQFSSFCIHQL